MKMNKENKKLTKELTQHLINGNWADDIAKEVAKAYIKKGVKGAVKKAKWMDDCKHDYTSEIVMDIALWHWKNMYPTSI